ncbi:MAG: HD domain-containing protein [Armatimonadota bacterium]|nr:HD domain-containing protein [Armatimonadota bacterium]
MTLEDALLYAVNAHRGQLRDGASPLPYVTHPVEVVANLRYVGRITDEDVLAAGFLHDVLEETSASPPDIESKFGRRVRDLVESVTRREPTTQETARLNADEIYALRSKMLLDEIAAMSPESQVIKLADRLSNVVGMHAARDGNKLARYVEQTRTMLGIIPEELNPSLWNAVRRAAGLKKREI